MVTHQAVGQGLGIEARECLRHDRQQTLPMADAARLAMTVVAEELAKRPNIVVARFVLFGRDALQVFTDVYQDLAASGG